MSRPHTFKENQEDFEPGFTKNTKTPQLFNAKIQGKYVLGIDRHLHVAYKNSPPSKSYGLLCTLKTGNPSAHSSEMVPFDLLTKGGKIHQKLWEYWLTKGPNALPSKLKLVEKGLAWVPNIFAEAYKAQKSGN